MSVTRKHFEALASSLRKTRPSKTINSELSLLHKNTCLEVAYALKKFNTAFNFEKFMKACGYSYNREGAFYFI